MDNETEKIERVFSRLTAAILDSNDSCPDKEHRVRMRRVVMDQVELAQRRVVDAVSVSVDDQSE